MLVLHGIYNNGKIELLDKNLPHIKAKAEIKITDNSNQTGIKKKDVWKGLSALIKEKSVRIGKIKWTRESLYER